MSGDADSAARWARVEAVFAGAVELPAHARPAFLDRECGADTELRAEVESLLAAHEDDGALPRLEAASPPNWRIGTYRLIEPIGSGGMGTVFLAEREGPDYVQRVALKLIRAGRSDPLLSERLRSERRILARLEHPNIARLIDGGVTPEGQPYFAMEYVAGTPLVEFCDTRQLTVRERLRLFLRIAEAVSHAHAQLVIHRDLKPSNILVSEDGHPKLLDFGIAKLVDPDDDATTTRTGAWGTPAYASPEQVRGEPAGTATDVYALGVLLYELLAGERPYRLDGLPAAEAQRIICEQVPPRPSERIPQDSGAVAARGLSADRLRRDLSGDLDTIVLKALAKEPERRYASVDAFAEDLRRHLDGRPVLARPDSASYRASRFVRRHRAAVSAAAFASVALLGGTAVSVWQARRATTQAVLASVERDRAQAEAEKAQLVTRLMADLFRLSDPNQMLGDTITARQVLDEGTARIEQELAGQPELQSALLVEVSRVYRNIGLLDRAEALSRRSLALRTERFGPESAEVAESLGDLGLVLAVRDQTDESVEALQRAIALRDALIPAPDTVASQLRIELGWQLRAAGDFAGMREAFERALDDLRSALGPASPRTGDALIGLAAALHEESRFDEAETLFQDALATLDEAPSRAHPLAATALLNVGMLRRLRERAAEAEPLLRSAHAMRLDLFGPDHPDLLEAAKEWGRSLHESGRVQEGERILAAALDRSRRVLGDEHQVTVGFYDAVGAARLTLGRSAEAYAAFERRLALSRTIHADHPELVFALIRAGEARLATGRVDAAEASFREALTRAAGPGGAYRLLALNGLGDVERERGRYARAAEYYDEAAAIGSTALRPDHRYVRRLQRDRAILLLRSGNREDAVMLLDSVAAMERRIKPLPHYEHGHTLLRLGEARWAAGDRDGAASALAAALEQLVALPTEHPHAREARRLLAETRR